MFLAIYASNVYLKESHESVPLPNMCMLLYEYKGEVLHSFNLYITQLHICSLATVSSCLCSGLIISDFTYLSHLYTCRGNTCLCILGLLLWCCVMNLCRCLRFHKHLQNCLSKNILNWHTMVLQAQQMHSQRMLVQVSWPCMWY